MKRPTAQLRERSGEVRAVDAAICGIDGQIAHGDCFHNERFRDLKAGYILANPPFNVSDRLGETLLIDTPGSGQWLTECTGSLPTNT